MQSKTIQTVRRPKQPDFAEKIVPPRRFLFIRKADDRYNSGLFYFHQEPDREAPDELTPALTIDDKPLKQIIGGLYHPESPHEFSVLPAEILGQVYEQFLGKVIRLTAGHQARIEDKPEVKKAGGIYYTPAYIVEYIVKHTVGKLLGAPGASAAGENGARRGSPDPAAPPTEGLPTPSEKGDLRSNPGAGSGDPRPAPIPRCETRRSFEICKEGKGSPYRI